MNKRNTKKKKIITGKEKKNKKIERNANIIAVDLALFMPLITMRFPSNVS